MLPALVGPVISEDALWACTTCGYCEAACPIELEHLGKFFKMRQQRVMMEGAFPHELKAVFAAYEAQSNPWGFEAATRGECGARAPGPCRNLSGEDVKGLDWLFYVGSAESFDPRGQKIARAFAQILLAGRRQIRAFSAPPRRRRGREHAPHGQRDAVPDAREAARGHVEWPRRHADRDLRSARVQYAAQRISGVRRALGR